MKINEEFWLDGVKYTVTGITIEDGGGLTIRAVEGTPDEAETMSLKDQIHRIGLERIKNLVGTEK